MIEATDVMMQPHDLRAEEELLGACLTVDRTLDAVQAEIPLRPDSFYMPNHRLIFAAMLELLHDPTPITEITVYNKLEQLGTLEAAGGRNRLEKLTLPASPSHAMHYAEIVRAKARWRQRFDGGTLIRQAAASEDEALLAEGQDLLADDVTNQNALYDEERQKDLLFALSEGRAKAEFFWPFGHLNLLQNGGMRRGQLVILSGYTSEGKSQCAGQILDLNRKHGRVCLYDNEMAPEEQAARRAVRATGLGYGQIMNGELDGAGQKKLLAYLNHADLHWPIVDTAGWTVDEVALHIRQHRWDFVVIDILHNFPFKDERELSASVARLKAAAKQANCCIVLVAHVNRGGVEQGRRRRPVRSDLRWSGDIENLADVVCFVYREQDPDTYESLPEGFIYFDKCRGGSTGAQKVRFNADRLRFELREEW